MSKFFKSTKGKIISIVLALVLIAGGIGGYFIFRNKNKLIYDYEKGAIANARVESAQYTPDMDNFIESNSSSLSVSFSQSMNNNYSSAVALFSNNAEIQTMTSGTSMSIEEFSELVDEYGTVENYAGAGKYLGYDIYEIKNEIAYVTKNVPAFNQWFRLPTMREEQGYVSIPYYEWWAYYLEMNDDILSITRVCWCTRSSYFDYDKGVEIEDHDDGTSFVQYEIMKINYYTDTNGDEVVECFIYSVGVDNVKATNICNTNNNDYYPFEYQYLKNVKDKTLIKYHITVAPRMINGMDIRGLYPYGVRREFTIVNYEGYTSIDVTKIDQPANIAFDVNSNNIRILLGNIGLDFEKFATYTSSQLLDKVAEQIIDNFEIKNKWAQIYKDSTNAIEIESIPGPFVDKEILISDVAVYVSCRGHDKKELEFDASADIYDMSKFDVNKEYSLSCALKNRDTGEIIILATEYNTLEEVYYAGSTTETYFRVKSTSLDLNSSVINITKDGIYDITTVLTEKLDDKDVILFDTLEIAYLRQYYGLEIPSYEQDGKLYNYSVKGVGGKLVITVSSEDI